MIARLVMACRAASGMIARGFLDGAALASRGLMDSDTCWVALEGAMEFIRAIAAGDVTTKVQREERLDKCRVCSALTPYPADESIRVGYCGKALAPAVDYMGGGPTCGCLVAGKTWVASEACPRGHWTAITIGGRR